MTTVHKAYRLEKAIRALKLAAAQAAMEIKSEPPTGAQLPPAAIVCISGVVCCCCCACCEAQSSIPHAMIQCALSVFQGPGVMMVIRARLLCNLKQH